MNRIIIDTSSLATIMASAKPTGSQANTQAAIKLQAAFNKVYSESGRYAEIKKALNTFYAERGLNFPCRILDACFSGGARNKARNYLTSLEVIALLGGVDERYVGLVKPVIQEYMKEKGLLERGDEALNSELEKDRWYDAPQAQSPYLTGHILSRLCRMSDKPSDMINTWDVGEFTIFGNKAQVAPDAVHLPVKGMVTLTDDDLPFARYPFHFKSSSLANNSFCQEFLASEKIGDAYQSGTDILTEINIAKQNFSDLIKKFALGHIQLCEEDAELKKTLADIRYLMINDNGKNGLQERLHNFNISANQAFNHCISLKNMYSNCRESARLFGAYNVQLDTDLHGRSTTIPLGERGVVRLVYDDVEGYPEQFDPAYWSELTPLHVWLDNSVRVYPDYIKTPLRIGNALTKIGNEYRLALNDYSNKVENYYLNCDSIFQQEKDLTSAGKEMDDAFKLQPRTSSPNTQAIQDRPLTSGENLLRNLGVIEEDPERDPSPAPSRSSPYQAASDRSWETKVAAVSNYIHQGVEIQKNKMELDKISNKVENTREHVFELRKQLTEARSELIHTTQPVPDDNYEKITDDMARHVNNINKIINGIGEKDIISLEFLNECAGITDNVELSEMIEDAAIDYLDRMDIQKNSGIRSAMTETF